MLQRLSLNRQKFLYVLLNEICLLVLATVWCVITPASVMAAVKNSTVVINSPTVLSGDVVDVKGAMGIWVSGGISADIINTVVTTDNIDQSVGTDSRIGIKIDNSSAVKVDGGTISIKGNGNTSHGISVTGQSSTALKTPALILKDTKISTEGNLSDGLLLDNSTIASAENTLITVAGEGSNGINLRDNSALAIKNSAIYTTNMNDAHAMEIQGSSLVKASKILMSTKGNYSHGVRAVSSSFTLNDKSVIETEGSSSFGISLENGSSADINATEIRTKGGTAHGVSLLSNALINADGVTISTSGDKSSATLLSMRSSANFMGSHLSTAGLGSHGVEARGGSSADIINTGITTAYGYGINSTASNVKFSDGSIKTSNDSAFGVVAASNSRVEITNSRIEISGKTSSALYASSSSSVYVKGGTILTQGSNTSAAYAYGGTVQIESTDINVAGNSNYFRVDKNGIINLKKVAPVGKADNPLLTTSTLGDFNAEESILNGDIIHLISTSGTDNRLNVSLNTSSEWSGAATVISKDNKADNINIALDGSSKWNVTRDSYTNGMLVNGGIVNFGEIASSGFKTVETAEYSGGKDSTLVMKTDLNTKEKLDLLMVSGNAEGKSDIVVFNKTPSGTDRSDALIIVAGDSSGAEFKLGRPDTIVEGVPYISAGAWKYRLENGTKPSVSSSAKEWYLLRSGTTPTGEAISQAAIQHDLWYTETNTMTKRLGIYRDNLWNGGFWFQAVANKEDFKIRETNTLNENQNFKTGTIGYDRKAAVQNGLWWYGAMAGYGKSNSDLVSGVGQLDSESYHASLYAVYRDNGGLYINTILKYNKYKNEMKITAKDSFTEELEGYDGGEWEQNGFGFSLQAGKRFDFKDSGGWYWEPQMQFSWNRVYSASYSTKSGIEVNIDDVDYVRLRGGLVVGREVIFDDGRRLDIYGDISAVHDFDGDALIRMSGAEHKSSLGGTWATFGLGANYRYDSGKFAHIRFQYSDGTSYREPFTVYAGLSFETN